MHCRSRMSYGRGGGVLFGPVFAAARGVARSRAAIPLFLWSLSFMFAVFCDVNPRWNARQRCAKKNRQVMSFFVVGKAQSDSCKWLKSNNNKKGATSLGPERYLQHRPQS